MPARQAHHARRLADRRRADRVLFREQLTEALGTDPLSTAAGSSPHLLHLTRNPWLTYLATSREKPRVTPQDNSPRRAAARRSAR